MEDGSINIADRLRAVRVNEDGTVWESHALWHNASRRGDADSSSRGVTSSWRESNLHQWRTHYSIESRADGLLDRILRKIGLR
jgi:hypothetical protein